MNAITKPTSAAAMQAEIERLKAELAAAKAAPRRMSLKVSDKGGVSLYGLRRFPVTFYKDEWTAILSKADAIREFIRVNDSALSTKGEAED